jgi:nucleotide-binding universal stress UspA family protein
MLYLVAVDDSAESDDAVAYAARHAERFDATLEIVHVVVPETEVLGDEIVLQGRKEATERGQAILDDAVEHAQETVGGDLDVDTQLVTGRPAAAIVQHSREADADAIFVGHRGLATEQEEVVGSVAKSIVSKASVPVTVVR